MPTSSLRVPTRRAHLLLTLAALLTGAAPAAAQISFAPLANQPPDNIYSIVTEPGTGTLYACNGLRVITSTNQGATWASAANSGGFNLKCLYMTAAGQLYAGAEKASVPPTVAGVFKYNKAANTWAPMANSPLNVSAILEDPATGLLYAGTGTTNNIAPKPINLGLGMYVFDGTAWATANTGMPNVPGYSVLPYIKGLARLTTGEMVAATYGNGVLKYSGGTWTTYGSALPNLNVNCLELGTASTLYAGTDNGVFTSTGATWATVQPGLPAGKPVRALLHTGGLLYAGLGYFHYQQGGLVGDIYTTTGTAAWTNAGAGFNSTNVLALQATGTTVLAAACGIWARPAGGNWAFSLGGMVMANRPFAIAHNSQGHLFAMCSNSIGQGSYSGTSFGYGGVFRSTDGGATWTSINQGLMRQGLTALFVDSQDNLWVAGHQFQGSSANPAWTAPALYKSTDNGATWVHNTSINTSQDGHEFMGEDTNGRFYVSHAFGSPTNLSATNDHATFDNTLLPNPAGANGKTYGFAINANNHVFVSTEIGGIFRSTANGAPGSFVNITNGTATGPIGNMSAFVDPYSGTFFSTGIHGQVKGVGNYPKINFASAPADNGTNMFPLNGLPDYSYFTTSYCDNRYNFYGYLSGYLAAQSGVYTATGPFTSSTVFTRLTFSAQSTLSYQFTSFMPDACGYLYATNVNGGGIYRSALPVNTPPASTLTSPATGALGVPSAAALSWTSVCPANTYRLQVATDAAFTAVVYDNLIVSANALTLPGGTLAPGTGYYWRVRAANAAGNSPWSAARRFTTATTLPITLVSFRAENQPSAARIALTWATVGRPDAAFFEVEKSPDGIHFHLLTQVPIASASTAPATYTATDDQPAPSVGYYRLHWHSADAGDAYSTVVAVRHGAAGGTWYLTSAGGRLVMEAVGGAAHPVYRVRLLNLLGAAMTGSTLVSDQFTVSLPTDGIAPGIYVLVIADEGGQPVHRAKVLVE